MKRFFVIAIFGAAFLVGANTNAQNAATGNTVTDSDALVEATTGAGITPGSFWYRHDLFYEEAWEDILGIFSRKAQLTYIEKRIKEREAEVWSIVSDNKNPLSDEAIRVLGLKQNHRLKAKSIALQGEDDARVKAIETNGLAFDAEYEKYVAKELDAAASLKKQVRDEIAAARKAGNTEALDDLAKQLKEAQREENEALSRNAQYVRTSEMISELLEDTVSGPAKAELVIQRAARSAESKAASDALWKKLLTAIEAAKKTVAKDDVKAAEDAVKDIQQSVRSTVFAVQKQTATERQKQNAKDVRATEKQEVKRPVAPAPRPAPAPQPKLEIIPSESSEQSPLTLVPPFGGLSGEVNRYFTATFTAEGGLPPYHYQLGTAGGFPPQGVILDAYGRISGTPKIPKMYTFDVCVVDMVGKSNCRTVAMLVEPPIQAPQPAPAPAPAPQPAPAPAIETYISITSTTCVGDGTHIDVSGTARGPVGASLDFSYGDVAICGVWSKTSSGECRRDAGQPEETQWTQRYYKGKVSGDSQLIGIYAPPDYKSKTVRYEKNCP